MASNIVDIDLIDLCEDIIVAVGGNEEETTNHQRKNARDDETAAKNDITLLDDGIYDTVDSLISRVVNTEEKCGRIVDIQNNVGSLNPFAMWHCNCSPVLSHVSDEHSSSNGTHEFNEESRLNSNLPWYLFTGENVESIFEQQKYCAALARSVSKKNCKYIDTHCHLDLLFDKEDHMGTFEAYKKLKPDTWARCFEGCITDYCFPELFKDDKRWELMLKEPNVYAAFGCHPHVVSQYDHELEELITARLCHEKVVGIGEMGLDYSRNNNQHHDLQKKIFRRQLKLAIDWNKPIVIHCREAENDCYEIMTEMVPHDFRIHRHCFKENYATAKRWMDYFPNLKFGLSPFIANFDSRATGGILSELPMNRILIETDSPYFLPAYHKECSGLRWNHPGVGFFVAAKLADVRDIGIVDVLNTIRQNTNDLYGI